MRFLNTTLPTGPRCDADARVGARVFCSKGLYVCMIVCTIVWTQLWSWREQSWYEVYFYLFILFCIYIHNSLLLEWTENVVVMSLGADLYICKTQIPSPNVSTTPLRQWGFRQCLPISWTTLRGKLCRHPIAVMGVVDTFGQYLWNIKLLTRICIRERPLMTSNFRVWLPKIIGHGR